MKDFSVSGRDGDDVKFRLHKERYKTVQGQKDRESQRRRRQRVRCKEEREVYEWRRRRWEFTDDGEKRKSRGTRYIEGGRLRGSSVMSVRTVRMVVVVGRCCWKKGKVMQ